MKKSTLRKGGVVLLGAMTLFGTVFFLGRILRKL